MSMDLELQDLYFSLFSTQLPQIWIKSFVLELWVSSANHSKEVLLELVNISHFPETGSSLLPPIQKSGLNLELSVSEECQ